SERVRDMFRSIIRSQEPDIERETVELLLHDFRDAILFHNADTVQQAFNAKVVTSLGEFLTNNVAEVVSTFSRQPTPAGVPREVTTVYVQTEAAKEALEQQLSERSITSPITIMVLHAYDKNELKGRVLDL